jgi:hypothetical protein
MKDTTKTILILVGIFALLIASIVLFFVDRKNDNDITIVDKTGEVCGEALLYFYKDSEYNYYFSCLKNIWVQVDGDEYEVSDALENKVVTIDELAAAGLKFSKEKIEG